MDLTKYREVGYDELQKELHKKKEAANVHELSLAADLNIKSVSTVRRAFNEAEQVASDEALTKVFKFLGFRAFVAWVDGQRTYFVSSE